jgi:hypothetical protein
LSNNRIIERQIPPETEKCLLQPHDSAINIHIPASGRMDIAECIASIRRMADFFGSRDKPFQAVVCYSWFLDQQLRQILPASSNIIKFQNLGHLFDFDEPSETIWRVFGERATKHGVNSVPHTTAMQKMLAEFANNGGVFKSGGMYILKDEIQNLFEATFTTRPC